MNTQLESASQIRDPVANACDLTAEITFTSEYAVAHGGFSDVYRGEWSSASSKGSEKINVVEVAIKVLRAFSRQEADLEKAKKRLNREVYVLKRLNHPNIALFHGVAFHHGHPAVVIKWYKHGTTPDYLRRHPKVDPLDMIKDIAKGLQYLHTLNIVHGDLKGSNTLVDDDGHAVLSDFGLAKVIEELAGPSGYTTTLPAGSVRWLAPELLFDPQDPMDEEAHAADPAPTTASDVWAFACVAYELITGSYPYEDERYDWNVIQSVIQRRTPVKSTDRWLLDSEAVHNLLKQCWLFEPEGRPSIEDIHGRMRTLNMAARK